MLTGTRYDVVVVGFGAAGAAAAIEAADNGARVLVLDRGYGGGATALSGGIVYAGGGTEEQHAGGYRDSADNMFAYLRREVGDAVSEATLRRFCEQSPAMIGWLKAHGCAVQGRTGVVVQDVVPDRLVLPLLLGQREGASVR